MGDTGAAVADVQRRLQARGMDLAEDGVYDRSTLEAVRVFQRERHLMAHGEVDDDTWMALLDAGHVLGDRLLYLTRPPMRGDDVRELQRTLSRLGFDTGSTDGIHGTTTDEALRDFQHNAGLRVDGIAGAATLRTLASLRRRHQEATTFEVLQAHDAASGGRSLTGLRIVVDAASAHDDVALGVDGPTAGAVVGDVARRLAGQLTARGATATLTALGGASSVSERAELANRLEADAVVSVGCTAVAEPAAEGITAHYFGDGVVTSRLGRRLAMRCVDEVVARTGAVDCDIHSSTARLLRESRAPAVTVEIGFISNPREVERLVSARHRHDIAGALAAAVQRWTEEPQGRG